VRCRASDAWRRGGNVAAPHRLHYRDDDGVVHHAEEIAYSQAWCVLMCEAGRTHSKARGAVSLPVTCIACLATQTVDDE
jgi:hypothetical protein